MIISSPLSFLIPRGGDSHLYFLALLSILSLLLHHLTLSAASSQPHFEGFDADDDADDDDHLSLATDLPLRSPPPPTTLSSPSDPTESHHGPPPANPDVRTVSSSQESSPPSSDLKKPSTPASSFDYFWDEDEFEGFPQHVPAPESSESAASPATPAGSDPQAVNEPESQSDAAAVSPPRSIKSFTVEIVCGSFLVMFIVNYFTGKKENENIALAWVMKFASRDSIFDKNFSFLGIGDTDDSPLLLKEGQNIFKFYASGRRFCDGMLATMELKSRHDLISRLYNVVVPCKDEITFEVYMNDDAMDQVVFAMARKKLTKSMQKEVRDLQRFAGLVAPPTGRKWLADEWAVVSESKEVAGDLITEVALDQV